MRPLLSALVLVLAVTACGDDDGADAGSSEPPTSVVDPQDDGSDVVEAGDVGTDDAGGDGDGTDGTAGDDGTTTTIPTDDPATGAPDDAASEDEGRDEPLVLVADLTAGAAVPPPGAEGASGRVEIQAADEGTLCFDMVAAGLGSAVTAAHLHQGAAGTSGEVVVGIGTPTATDDETDTWNDVCVEVEPALLDRIEADPGDYYANIHTELHPRSAVRGQLRAASIFDVTLS